MKKIIILALSVLFVLCVLSCDGSVYSSVFSSSESTPLSIEAKDADLNVTVTIAGFSSDEINLKYSLDGGTTKSDVTSGSGISVSAGKTICFYGDRTADGSYSKYINIDCDSACYVYGNVMSLIDSDGFEDLTSIDYDYAFMDLFANNTNIKNHATYDLVLPATTLAESCYNVMFRGCTGLTSAPALPATTLLANCYYGMFYDCIGLTSAPELAATTLAESCYFGMFYGCTGLTSAPSLPAETLATACYAGMFYGCTGLESAPELAATTLAESCYYYMFSGCTGLESAPELAATTLAVNCYNGMFYGCTGLTSAPSLPAETLATACYYYMFYGCSKLKSITCLATDISASSCTTNWVYGVSSSGTFTKSSSMTGWGTDENGIPSGWTVKNYSEE